MALILWPSTSVSVLYGCTLIMIKTIGVSHISGMKNAWHLSVLPLPQRATLIDCYSSCLAWEQSQNLLHRALQIDTTKSIHVASKIKISSVPFGSWACLLYHHTRQVEIPALPLSCWSWASHLTSTNLTFFFGKMTVKMQSCWKEYESKKSSYNWILLEKAELGFEQKKICCTKVDRAWNHLAVGRSRYREE